MRCASLCFCFFLLISLNYDKAAAGPPLPPPPTAGGPGLFEVLNRRASAPGGDFSPAVEISPAELSAVLWAATGLNRSGQGWVVPLAEGVPPYCRVYVASAQGVFLYDWAGHALEEISPADIRGRIAAQSFVGRAGLSLIFVAEAEGLAKLKRAKKAESFSYLAAGAMSQDVYLAAAALGLNARYISSLKNEVIQTELRLAEGDQPLGLMMLGK